MAKKTAKPCPHFEAYRLDRSASISATFSKHRRPYRLRSLRKLWGPVQGDDNGGAGPPRRGETGALTRNPFDELSNLREKPITRRVILTFATAILFAFGPASAQSLKQQIVGTWTLASGAEKFPDGKIVFPWANGTMMFDGDGHTSMFLVGKGREKGVLNPRIPFGPFIAFYGHYTVNEAAQNVTIKVALGSTPTIETQTRVFAVAFKSGTMTLTGSQVKTPKGMITPINQWKRAK